MSRIKVVTLVSGPPIIAKTKINHRTGGDYYVLEDPLNIVYKQKPDEDAPKFGVHNLLVLSADSVIEVMVSNVLFTYTPLPEIIDQYNSILLNELIPIDDDS